MSGKLKKLLSADKANPEFISEDKIDYSKVESTNLPPELIQIYKRRGMLNEQESTSKQKKQIPKNITKPTIPKNSNNDILVELKSLNERIKSLEKKLTHTKIIDIEETSIIIEIGGKKFLAKDLKIIE